MNEMRSDLGRQTVSEAKCLRPFGQRPKSHGSRMPGALFKGRQGSWTLYFVVAPES